MMAKSPRRDRDLRQLEEATRESIRRSFELIRKSEKLLLQSQDLLRLYISNRPSYPQTGELKK